MKKKNKVYVITFSNTTFQILIKNEYIVTFTILIYFITEKVSKALSILVNLDMKNKSPIYLLKEITKLVP